MKRRSRFLRGDLLELGVLFTLLLSARAHPKDRYFKEDFYTGARYLKLRVNGTYEIIDREHAGVWIADRGHWSEEHDRTLLFESDQHVKNVVTPVGQVLISGPEGASLLPSLRSKLSALLDVDSQDEHVLASAVGSLAASVNGGHVEVTLDPVVTERGVVSRREIQSLLNAIDGYLLSQLRHVSRRQLETFEDVTFLVSLGEGVRAPILDAEKIRARVAKADGQVPAYVLAEITQELFEREIKTPYPFRFLRPK